LLVEDDPGDIRLFREALSQNHPAVNLRTAMDGEAALRWLRNEANDESYRKPDLIILDLNLPRIDGRHVLAVIKADPDLRCIPTVVMTTSGADDDVRRAYDLHANCYIRKPTELSEYMNAVAQCEAFWLSVVRLPNS
jgi:CheY-like chemotaxis protein